MQGAQPLTLLQVSVSSFPTYTDSPAAQAAHAAYAAVMVS